MFKLKSMKPAVVIVSAAVLLVAVVGVILSRGAGDNGSGQAVALQPGLISPATYQQNFQTPGEDHFLLDVRTPEEFAQGHIAGAVNIPVQVLDQYLDMVPRDQEIVLYCRSGNRSVTAAQILRQAGFAPIYDIQGGVLNWTRQNLPLE